MEEGAPVLRGAGRFVEVSFQPLYSNEDRNKGRRGTSAVLRNPGSDKKPNLPLGKFLERISLCFGDLVAEPLGQAGACVSRNSIRAAETPRRVRLFLCSKSTSTCTFVTVVLRDLNRDPALTESHLNVRACLSPVCLLRIRQNTSQSECFEEPIDEIAFGVELIRHQRTFGPRGSTVSGRQTANVFFNSGCRASIGRARSFSALSQANQPTPAI